MHPDRIAAYWFGQIAELRVILYLTLRGWRIRARRCKTPYGEIDIIAIRGNTLLVCEVKARRVHDVALASLSYHQQERLRRAGAYLTTQARYANHAIRFDCITVSWYMGLRHLRDAF